ncbi:MAG: prefoldin subunit alpha [Nanoarchaeota archaeon]|nr:prefoldin subunit alpha [Nanoarchaeota archaeon]
MENEELNHQFHIFEKQIMQIQSEIQAIEQASIDMNRIKLGLLELKDKIGNEILAPIGRGIFMKVKLVSDEPIVDVGEGNFVKKTIPETTSLIEEQEKKLDQMKSDLESELDKISEEITKTMEKTEKKHDHEKGCKCEEEKGCKCEEGESCEDECECGHSH